MEKFVSKTIKNLKLKGDNLLFEQLTRDSLFTVLSNMANSINMDIDKTELKKVLGKVKFVNNLDYNQFNIEGNKIYLSKDLKDQDLITKVYVLASAFARVLTTNKDKSVLNKGMEEALSDMVANNLTLNFSYISSKNRYARDYMEFILSLADDPYRLMAEYFLTNGYAFDQEIANIAFKNNLSLYNIEELKVTNENKRQIHCSSNFYPTLINRNMRVLMNECFNDNNTSLTSVFSYNNLFLEDHLRSRFLNDFSLDSLELFAATAATAARTTLDSISLNLTDDLEEVSNYFRCYPYDFYRIRPFVDEKLLGLNTRSILNENDLKFNAIVEDIKAGKFKGNLAQYTCYYNYHASADDRLVFLNRLVSSDGITNGFLLNELLEIMKTKTFETLDEYNKTYCLIYDATTQFLKRKVYKSTARYDAYTIKVLRSSSELMKKYNVRDSFRVALHEGNPTETYTEARSFVRSWDNESKYLSIIYNKCDVLRNPESLSYEELMTVLNDLSKNRIRVTRKYFQDVLNSRVRSFQDSVNQKIIGGKNEKYSKIFC
jgi:hypothetical protein